MLSTQKPKSRQSSNGTSELELNLLKNAIFDHFIYRHNYLDDPKRGGNLEHVSEPWRRAPSLPLAHFRFTPHRTNFPGGYTRDELKSDIEGAKNLHPLDTKADYLNSLGIEKPENGFPENVYLYMDGDRAAILEISMFLGYAPDLRLLGNFRDDIAYKELIAARLHRRLKEIRGGEIVKYINPDSSDHHDITGIRPDSDGVYDVTGVDSYRVEELAVFTSARWESAVRHLMYASSALHELTKIESKEELKGKIAGHCADDLFLLGQRYLLDSHHPAFVADGVLVPNLAESRYFIVYFSLPQAYRY